MLTADPTPALIRRNTIYLALAQMFVGTGTLFTGSMGPLMIESLLGSPLLVGLSTAVVAGSRFIASYSFGLVTDRFGRRSGLFLGLGLGLAGALVIGTAMQARWFPGVITGMVIFSMGMNGVQQLRLAAAEMYPPSRRAVIIGFMLTGSLVGVVMAPLTISLTFSFAPLLGLGDLAMPWFIFPALIVPALVLVTRVRPDPREIAADLTRYFPSYVPPVSQVATDGAPFGPREFFADAQRRIAAVTMLFAQATMSMAMITVPIQLHHHGLELPAVALSISIHVGGMFGPSIPMGKLADRFGRGPVLIAGAFIEAIGAGITTFTSDHASITFGVFLVGVGWCAANVASSAMVIDSAPAHARGRAVGLLDTFTVAGLFLPLSVGVLISVWGLQLAGSVAMVLAILPLLLRRLLADDSIVPWPKAWRRPA